MTQITLGFAQGEHGEQLLLRLPQGILVPGMVARLHDGSHVTVKSFANIREDNVPAYEALSRAYPMERAEALFLPVWRRGYGA